MLPLILLMTHHKDNKYDSSKLLSFTYNNKDVSYSTYNDNYLVNVSFKINSIDVINSILNDGYSGISVQIFDKYNYSLSENTYYQNTYVSNAVSYVGRITIVNHLSGTYIGNDEKLIHSQILNLIMEILVLITKIVMGLPSITKIREVFYINLFIV